MKVFLFILSIVVLFATVPAEAAYPLGSYCSTQIVDATEFLSVVHDQFGFTTVEDVPIWVNGNGPYRFADVFYGGWGSLDPINCPVKTFGFQDKDRRTAPETGDGNATGDAGTGPSDSSSSSE